MSDIDKAIEIVKHSQDTHQQWLDWIDWHEAGGDCDCEYDKILETAGDREHQVSRIERYQFVIDTLEGLK